MTESAAKEQIAYTIIDVLLCLEPQDKGRQQIFQILSKEGSLNTATARCMIKDVLFDNGHIVDHERIQLCIDTFQGLTNGFARWFHEPSEDYKEQYPAWELTKLMGVEESVNWTERWQDCGGKIYPGNRLIATIDDSIWLKISNFGLPFPPFALNSGMGWFAVPHREFLELGGQLGKDIQPKTPRSKHDKFDDDIRQELLRALKSGEARYRVKVEIVKDEQPRKKIPKPSDEQTG
jgi:hypothetical protein